MGNHFLLGMAIVSISGIFNGGFPLPMKYSRLWKWENTWLVFSLTALLVLPWVLAVGFTPHLRAVYSAVPDHSILVPLAFGFLWGVAQVTFGLGIDAVGMALAFSVVMGLACLFGSLIPMLVLHPADLFRARGILLLVSMPVLFAGLVSCGMAGKRRDKENPPAESAIVAAKMSFTAGLVICIFTGVFGANLNLGFAFGGGIIRSSQVLGGGAISATYPLWAIVLGAGFIPNLLYCGYLLLSKNTWTLFSANGSTRELAIGMTMGSLWLAGIVCYGFGATVAGKYGSSLGFALFLAVSIVVSNILGLLTGEWRSASGETKRIQIIGIAIVLVSVVILNLGGVFE